MCIAVFLGMALAPCVMVSQAPAAAPAMVTTPADQQPTREQLTRLFEVMRVRQQMDSMLKMIPSMAKQQMQAQVKELSAQNPGMKMTPEQQAAMDKTMDKFMVKAMNIISFDEMLDDMVGLYQRHLTRTDVEAMTAFYESPAGQHLLDAQPAIIQEYMPMIMKQVTQRSKALTDDLAKEIKEQIAAEGKAAGTEAPEKK
jgi:hypothetical protein